MKIHLSLIRCRYCEHENPADAKFCGACGGELHLPPHLASCPRCGAVNSASATVCIWCHGAFPTRNAGALVAASPAAKVFLPRRSSRALAVAVVLAAIGALAYYGYRQTSLVDEPRAAGGETPADAKSADDTSTTSGNPLATPARAAANPARAGRQPVESQEGKSAAAAITRSQTINPGKPGEAPRQQACTEGLAALGLCATKPEADKAGGPEPSGAAACTSEAAALGLCAPRSTQRRE